jgi:hypothetical protein
MTYTLFLDDVREPNQVTWARFPQHNIAIVRNYDEFTKHVSTFGLPGFVCFDHDLDDQHYYAGLSGKSNYGPVPTGYDCAKWLVDFCENSGNKFPDYVVHSMNPVGKKNIESYIENAKKYLGM